MERAKVYGDEFELANLKPDAFQMFLTRQDPAFKNFRAVLLETLDDKPDQSLPCVRGVLPRDELRTLNSTIDSVPDTPQSSVNQVVTIPRQGGWEDFLVQSCCVP